jgi:hypothetical protein
VAISVVGAFAAVVLTVAGAYWADRRHQAALRADLLSAFIDPKGPMWDCDWGDDSGDRATYSCYIRNDGPDAPTVNYEVLPTPIGLQDTISQVRAGHWAAAEQDHSGYGHHLTLLSTGGWVPPSAQVAWAPSPVGCTSMTSPASPPSTSPSSATRRDRSASRSPPGLPPSSTRSSTH